MLEKAKNENSEYVIFIVAIVLGGLSFVEGDLAFAATFFGIPYAIGKGIMSAMDKTRRNLVRRILTYGGCALLLVSGPSGLAYCNHRVVTTAQTVANLLEDHKDRNGEYPEKLEEFGLVPAARCPNGMKIAYSTDKTGQDFYLTCVAFAFKKYTYSSKTAEWESWD